jgi:seryl-tRNA synthetase
LNIRGEGKMNTGLLELEEMLNKEIEAYSRLEKYITDKKECLIKGDIEKLINIDYEIEKFNHETEKIKNERERIRALFGQENLSLKDIVEKIEENDKTSKISSLRKKLKNIAENIYRKSSINAQLIEHSLRIIEQSVISIANALIPEASAYNNLGKANGSQNKTSISSITHEI